MVPTLEETTFTFSPSIADQGLLAKVLKSHGVKNFTITPTTNSQGETDFKIWTFEGGDNITSIKNSLVNFFDKISEDGFVKVRLSDGSEKIWEFNSQNSPLKGLTLDADEIAATFETIDNSFEEKEDDLDVATISSDPLPEEVTLFFSPDVSDQLCLENSLKEHGVEMYTLFCDEGEGDEDLDFRLNLWSDSLASAKLALKQFFERIGQEDVSVELKWTSEKRDMWEF